MKYFIVLVCTIFLFTNCFDNAASKNKHIESNSIKIKAQGKKIAMETFATLSSNLQKAMKEGGVTNAVKYCNLAASPLVDSLEQLHNVSIKRTSLKVRNSNNLATQQEKMQLESYQQAFNAGKELEPSVIKKDLTTFYAPIYVMPLCQKCHGKVGDQLMETDYAIIQSLYPSDQAINYKNGDLRGMWSITFREK